MSNKQSVLNQFKRSKYYDYEINTVRYNWSVRLFRMVRAALKVNLTLHDENNDVSNGQIFVINHFSRFETFIPQYLIYEETGAYCCSIAHSEFFKGDESFAKYLLEVGGIPHSYAQILPLLAIQVLRGRKIIIFPEGGMVKNRHVINSADGYRVYSRTKKQWRKQHTGAAVISICVDLFKQAVKYSIEHGENEKLDRWVRLLKLDSKDSLSQLVYQSTLIVPTNITFYPIRITENFLLKGTKLLNPGIRRRHLEELLIESNIILRDTDMDIHIGDAINITDCWDNEERQLQQSILPSIESVDQIFDLQATHQSETQQVAELIHSKSEFIRDQYAHNIYRAVTVNLSHLAAVLIMKCVEHNQLLINHQLFRTILYLSLKELQRQPGIYLHRSLRNPDYYDDLLAGTTKGLQRFIDMAVNNQLISINNNDYRLLTKLEQEFSVDEIRIENLIAVYANEVSAIDELSNIIDASIKTAELVNSTQLAKLRFDDEKVLLQWDLDHAIQPVYEDIENTLDLNSGVKETATQSPTPFLLEPKTSSNRQGVLLIHGLLASPAEVRPFAECLVEKGYTVFGVRLKGHGTTPLDLASIEWQDWYKSVKNGYDILSNLVENIHLVGFSTGGALALLLASERPSKLLNVVAICVPIKFQNPNMMLISLLHGVNQFTKWVSTKDVIKAFVNNDTEHPDINYRHIPVSALYELRQLIDEMEKKLNTIVCPVALLQAQNDPVVDPSSALRIYKQLESADATLIKLPSNKHGILYENTEQIWERISSFLKIHSGDSA